MFERWFRRSDPHRWHAANCKSGQDQVERLAARLASMGQDVSRVLGYVGC